MSYDLRIYTIQKQNFNDLIDKFNIEIDNDGFFLPLKNHQVFVSGEMLIEDEDIPQQIGRELPGIKYLIECNLQPITNDEKTLKELFKLSKVIAKNGIGVIENPQTDEIILPSGVKRVLQTEKTERFSLIELSWWFNHEKILSKENISLILKEIEKNIPEALPRRYGLYEPPKEKFTTIDSLSTFLVENIKDSVVWYPKKPVNYVNFAIPSFIGPMKIGYRFGRFSISIDSAVLNMPGWKTAIVRLFRNLSEIICPFYGDIYILKNHIRSRNVSYNDHLTEEHPITSWWWNGIPRKLGIGIVIGKPLLSYVKIKQNSTTLNNGCQLLSKIESEKINALTDKDIKISRGLYQPNRLAYMLNKKHTKLYPKIWPFDGPFSE